MLGNDTSDRVSRRNVLEIGATLAGAGTLGGLGIHGWNVTTASTVRTVSAETQNDLTMLGTFAKDSPLAVARADTFITVESTPFVPEATMNPEGVLAFVPRRLADEDGRVGLNDMLFMSGVRALEGDLTTAMAGAVGPGDWWFPVNVSELFSDSRWFPYEVFVSEDGLEATRVIAFRDEEWGLNDPLFPDEWSSEGDTLLGMGQGTAWSAETHVVEAGTSLEEMTAEGMVLLGAAGHNFFPTDRRGDVSVVWEELADAEAATVLSPDDLTG